MMTQLSRRSSARGGQKRKRGGWVWPVALLLPAVFAVLLALGYPMFRQIVMSFQHYGLEQQFRPETATWAGLENYATIVSDPHFWIVFAKSVGFCLWTAGWTMVIGIGLAALMGKTSKAIRNIMSTTLVIVWAMPHLASLTVWQWLIDPNSGLINYLLTELGFDFMGFNWLASSYWTFYAIASALIIWASIPLVTITIHAAMAQVPAELMEAAQIDGATGWQRLSRILLPMIAPVIALIGILQIIWDLRVFTQIYVLQEGGGIASETDLLGTYVYRTGLLNNNYGVASALAMVILALTLLITSGYLRILFKQGDVK